MCGFTVMRGLKEGEEGLQGDKPGSFKGVVRAAMLCFYENISNDYFSVHSTSEIPFQIDLTD